MVFISKIVTVHIQNIRSLQLLGLVPAATAAPTRVLASPASAVLAAAAVSVPAVAAGAFGALTLTHAAGRESALGHIW